MPDSTEKRLADTAQRDDDLISRLRRDVKEVEGDPLHLNDGKDHQPELEQREP